MTRVEWSHWLESHYRCIPDTYIHLCYRQRRNELRWHPGQETSLASPCSNLWSFGSKCTVLKKVIVTLLEFFGAPRSHLAPPAATRHLRSDLAPGELFLVAPLVRPLATEEGPLPPACRSQPENSYGQNVLNLSEQQHLVWETASRSPKWHNMLDYWGHGSFGPRGNAYAHYQKLKQ